MGWHCQGRLEISRAYCEQRQTVVEVSSVGMGGSELMHPPGAAPIPRFHQNPSSRMVQSTCKGQAKQCARPQFATTLRHRSARKAV